MTGELKEMDLPITEEQMLKYNNGEMAQRAFPNLTADEREFIITGTTADVWEAIFSDIED